MILLTGVTGHLGGEVLEQVLRREPSERIAVLARRPESVAKLRERGLEVRIADFDDPQTLDEAFEGVRKMLFVSTMSTDRSAQQGGVVDAAIRAGVRHIVYTGLAIRDIEDSHVRGIMQSHFDTERRLEDADASFTFLRNTMYAEAIPAITGPTRTSASLRLAGGVGRVPYALRSELAEAAAVVMTSDGHEGRTYTLTGSESWSYGDLAAALGAAGGPDVSYKSITNDDFESALRDAGLPEFAIWLTLNTVRDIADGQYDVTSADLEHLLGRAPAGLAKMLQAVSEG